MNRQILWSVLTLALVVPFYALLMGSNCGPDLCEPQNSCQFTVEKEGDQCPTQAGYPWKPEFAFCDRATDGSSSGVCIKDVNGTLMCVSSANDPCVKVGLGRINCCTNQGCTQAHGTRCPSSGYAANLTACDPISFYAVGSPGAAAAAGTCNQGFCETTGCTAAACVTGTWTEFDNDGDASLCKNDICVNQQCSSINVVDDAIQADLTLHKCGNGDLVCREGDCTTAEPD